ncbi:MAG TPA: zf-HC2 domain-containing protein [Pyrinomonadaceae bacterium]|nr:zf-HC2 domain-containing protein [Pyrinomonadaceae bacterium]
MKECIDEGTLQAWFDGQLAPGTAASVALHLASCPSCAQAAGTVENENLLLSSALETEFAEGVPTERIRQRLETAIAENQIARPGRAEVSAKAGWWVSLLGLLFASPQRAFGYAGLAAVIILGAILGVVYLKRSEVVPVAQNQPGKPISLPTTEPSPVAVKSAPGTGPAVKPTGPVQAPKNLIVRKTPGTNRPSTGLLPGERDYVKTIAALNKSLKSDSPMRPSLEVEYEHNVALLDSAIEMTRDAVRKNPKDTQASQFMLAAYQSKVDLLNQVAEARRFNTQK